MRGLSVTGTGVDTAPDVVARAFDSLSTTGPLGMGTGLGASMIYGLAEQSGGQVRIHSQPGPGTTVALDDEPAVRVLVGEGPADLGSTAAEAADGAGGLPSCAPTCGSTC